MIDMLRELAAHMEWADALVWKAVIATDGAMADRTMHERLYHSHMVQHSFLSVWNGTYVPKAPDPNEFADAAAILDFARQYHHDFREWLAHVDSAALGRVVDIPWASYITRHLGREVAPIMLGESILQAILHTQYHRGQINTRVRELGGQPPNVDYIFWLWFARPAPEWPQT